jgi:hypothetical protein
MIRKEMMKKPMMDEEAEGMPEKQMGDKPEMGMNAPKEGMNEGGDDNFRRVMVAAGKIIYDDKTFPAIMKMLQGDDPAQSLARTTMLVMSALYQQSKGSMPPDVIPRAAAAVMALLAELAAESGIELGPEQLDQAKAMVEQALQGQKQAQPGMQQGMQGGMQGGMVRNAMGA